MRALVVGGSPDGRVANIVRDLAENHDVVIAADAGASACLSAGVRPDLVVGDFDSLAEGDLRQLETLGVPLDRVPAEKDVTDLDLAIRAAREAGADSLTVTGVTGGRLDHSLAALGSLVSAADLAPAIVEPNLEVWVLAEGARESLDLHSRVGRTVSLIALTDAVVSCSGVRYPLASRPLGPLSSLGVSNVVECDPARVSVRGGVLLVLLLLEHDGDSA